MLKLALEYFLFAFVASLGVLQIAAAYARLGGLSFFTRPIWGYIFGSIAVVGAFTGFYIVANPNPEVAYAITFGDLFRYGWSNPKDPGIGLIMGEGECAVFFLVAIACALSISLLVSSIVKRRISRETIEERSEETLKGLEALRETTLFQAISHSLRKRKGQE